jgi:hypothetical protein
MDAYIPLIIVSILCLVSGGIFFFGFHIDQTNRPTVIYAVIMLLLGIGLGFLTYYNNKQDNLNLASSYTWMQVFFALLGLFHTWFMYKKLFWSKRDGFAKSRDSFLPELLYGIFLMTLVTVGILAALSYKGQTVLAGLFWAVGIPFLVPFMILKTFDGLNQIPKRDFSQKWIFSKEPIREDNWHWVNELWVEFEVYQSWSTERRRAGRKARFRIRAPRQVPLREVYRLAVREYNQKGPEVVLQDLGFEAANNGAFWWLFSIKFMWKKPNTWFRSIRYLDPMQATVEGELLPTDIVVARRMSFSSDAGFADDGEIAMGEM